VIDNIAVDFYPDIYAPVSIFGIVVGMVVEWTESRGQITCAVATDPAWVHARRTGPCGSCRGSGLQNGLDGPVPCDTCNGECVIGAAEERNDG
jgi:hypothetical protein